ncbi:MAG: hypothetical protein GF333_08185 [Candidatus Omnitrophica bacterium]|nr:hypothetical protein [Candidatus Omnitrophota bacterium]
MKSGMFGLRRSSAVTLGIMIVVGLALTGFLGYGFYRTATISEQKRRVDEALAESNYSLLARAYDPDEKTLSKVKIVLLDQWIQLKILAEEAAWTGAEWEFYEVTILSPHSPDPVFFQTVRINIPETPRDFAEYGTRRDIAFARHIEPRKLNNFLISVNAE